MSRPPVAAKTGPIKILHIIPSLAMGGAEQLLVDIVKGTDANQFQHAVVQLGGPEDRVEALTPFVQHLENLHWSGRSEWWRAARRIAATAKRWQPDVVQSSLFEANIAARLTRLLGVRAVLVTNVVSLEYEPSVIRLTGWSPNKVRLRVALDASTARLSSSTFVACSHAVERSTARALGVSPAAVRTIYNGVDPRNVEHDQADSARLRASLGIPPEDFVFLNLSRLVPFKGQSTAVEAFALAFREQPGFWLALAGGGSSEPALRRQVNELGLERRVLFLGQPKRVGPVLGIADAYVFPSLVEGFSLALIEALLCGLPTIASNIAPNAEVIHHGQTGLLFEADNPASLAAQMRLLSADSTLATALAEAGHQLALSQFTTQQTMPQWEQLYRSLALR